VYDQRVEDGTTPPVWAVLQAGATAINSNPANARARSRSFIRY
jgi:hypothetical protein